MLTLIHVSDLHFGPPYVPRVGEALLELAPTLSPDLIVASGDFTQRAKAAQFEQAAAFLDRLPNVPKVVCPGNHDVPLYRLFERLLRPTALYRKHIAAEMNTILDVPGARIVSLDSTAPHRTVTNGRIDEAQLEFCARAFERAAPEAYRIVVTHHHFAPAPDYERDRVLLGAQRAIERFEESQVDLILGGHLHRGHIGSSLDVSPGADQARGILIVRSGTTTSRRGRTREREKNTLNLIEIEGDLIAITPYMFLAAADAFVPTSRHLFSRPGRHFHEALPGGPDAVLGDRPLRLLGSSPS